MVTGRLRSLVVIIVAMAALMTGGSRAQEALPSGARETDQVMMDDGFQYRLVDFGLGSLGWAVRHTAVPAGTPTKVFWYMIEVTNVAGQQVAQPKYVCYVPSTSGPCALTDNQGKRYYTGPVFSGLSYPGVYDPTPKEYKDFAGDYKPGERRYFIRYCDSRDFAPDTQWFRLPMNEQTSFLLPHPLQRNRKLDTHPRFKQEPSKPETWPPKVFLVSPERAEQP